MSLLLLVHIIGMFSSLLATTFMVGGAALSQTVHSWFIRLNILITALGLGSGFILMLSRPLDFRCALLFGYLVAFAASYVYVRQKMSRLSRVAVED